MADTIATAADYADAMMTARRAKKVLWFLLLLILLAQLAIFGVARYTNIIFPEPIVITSTTQPATAPATASSPLLRDVLRYLIGATDFLGIVLGILLSFVLLLLLNIMLIGRLIGVARMTSAFVWSLVLLVLLFPWQGFLETYDWKPTGVLYTWEELLRDARFANEMTSHAFLKWARFVGFPVVALIVLLSVRVKSNRGLRQALGEAPPDATGADLA